MRLFRWAISSSAGAPDAAVKESRSTFIVEKRCLAALTMWGADSRTFDHGIIFNAVIQLIAIYETSSANGHV
jgi:hypothetical protein